VIEACLAAQESAKPRGRVARFFGADPLHPDACSWYAGALGEFEVAARLSQLGDGWTVLHAVPVGSGTSDIDHVVIGPPGIFTINAKHHAGKTIYVGGSSLKIDGFPTDHVRNARFEAERASKLLRQAVGGPVGVTPLIVVVGSASITKGKKPPTVTVLPVERVHRWLLTRARTLSAKEVMYFSQIAEDHRTWHTDAPPPSDGPDQSRRFGQLQQEVAAARTRRRLWLLAPAALLIGAVVATAGSILGIIGVAIGGA
jgi:hypothetical protein